MYIPELPKVAKLLVAEILGLPAFHSNNTCPWESAKSLCASYLETLPTRVADAYGSASYPCYADILAITKLQNLIASQYDDGRTCPIRDVQFILKKMYHDDPSCRHRWFTCYSVVSAGLAEKLIVMEGSDIELLMAACASDVCTPVAS